MMERAYLNPFGHIIGNAAEFGSLQSRLPRRNIADTHLGSSPGSAIACDSCSLHVATSLDSVTTYDTYTPHPTSPAAIAHDGIDMMYDAASPHLSFERPVMMQKTMHLNSETLNALVGEHSLRSSTYISDRDDNASDTSSDIRQFYLQPNNRRDRSSSPPSECARLDVTRVGSECSNGDGDCESFNTWCEQDQTLVREVLAAECSLPDGAKMDKEVHTRLASHSNYMGRDDEMQFCGLSSSLYQNSYKGQANGTPQPSYRNMKDMLCSENSFARCDIPIERTASGPPEDPTLALQGRLQDLLLVARVSDFVQEQEKDVHASSHSGSLNVREDEYEDGGMGMRKIDFMKSLSEDRRTATEAEVLRNELNSMSSELAEVKKALAFQKRDKLLCSGRQTQQTAAEAMYCKETIQRLVQQMQAEMEQWSQLQDILYKLQGELASLTEAQRFWEERAHRAEAQLLSLQEELHDWRCLAQSAKEELVMLRCERQILKDRIEMMEDAQMCMSGVNERLVEERRGAMVGTRHEEFGVCESFVHSRNESSRSSVDLGASSQRSFRKGVKKSINFSTNNENINTDTFQFGNVGVSIRAEAAGMQQLAGKKDDAGSKGKAKNPKPFAHFMNVNYSKDSSAHVNRQERKKARLFALKEKLNIASNGSNFAFNSENVKSGVLVGHAISARQDHTDTLWTLKPKASLPCAPTSTPLPSAPTSTPSRVLFGNIVNISNH
ncbi:hypothetical protein GOP47_0024450 [Adiantum capillus-veneris]|uniref:Uncharacterized protein n=1 Tax=Adiantum capillus-veneris TaxID=13818 RepID=A0A9D4U310_ADICA|nr:hypothetical protein GOP47_0024450 [Adiantum capillus-veneris]